MEGQSASAVDLVRREGLAYLTVNRPDARNALNQQAMADLDQALDRVAGWDVHGLFITGAGDRAFISGGDLKELESIREEGPATDMARRMRTTLDRIPALPMPVVAVVNGPAIGGGAEVAIACDYRVAADDAAIGFVQARLGMMPGWGGAERLVLTIGRGRALHLLTTGRTLTAQEASAIGLFEEVVPRAQLGVAVSGLARELAAVPLHALAGIKRAVDAVQPFARPDLAGQATQDFARAWVHQDHWQAMEREVERRSR